MRKYLLTVLLITGFMFIATNAVNAQISTGNWAVRVWSDFDRNQGQLTFYSYNEDFCYYYLLISFIDADGFEGISPTMQMTAIVGPGKRIIRTYKAKTGATRHVYRYHSYMYRGNTEKPNADFIYALPVATGNMATARIVGGDMRGRRLVFDLPSDTVYACRSGVMCDDNLKSSSGNGPAGELSSITLYHADGSFTKYIYKGKSLVFPGQKIKMGSPIAVVERDLGKYSVSFSAYFLDKEKLRPDYYFPEKYTNFLPFFQTSNEGKTHLISDGVYTCDLTDEMRMQDTWKGKKKKHRK